MSQPKYLKFMNFKKYYSKIHAKGIMKNSYKMASI